MRLIVGLGNPEPQYRSTRHNLGFRILNGFQKKHQFSEFKSSKEFKSSISKGLIKKEEVLLAKPQTLMNSSGKAVRLMAEANHLRAKEVLVVHDDIDIGLGEIKIVKNKGAGGHKGVQSVIDELGKNNFIRLRIGIKPPDKNFATWDKPDLRGFVLKRFTKSEERVIKNCFPRYLEALYLILVEGWKIAMNKFN